jgi:hypothetical protein
MRRQADCLPLYVANAVPWHNDIMSALHIMKCRQGIRQRLMSQTKEWIRLSAGNPNGHRKPGDTRVGETDGPDALKIDDHPVNWIPSRASSAMMGVIVKRHLFPMRLSMQWREQDRVRQIGALRAPGIPSTDTC